MADVKDWFHSATIRRMNADVALANRYRLFGALSGGLALIGILLLNNNAKGSVLYWIGICLLICFIVALIIFVQLMRAVDLSFVGYYMLHSANFMSKLYLFKKTEFTEEVYLRRAKKHLKHLTSGLTNSIQSDYGLSSVKKLQELSEKMLKVINKKVLPVLNSRMTDDEYSSVYAVFTIFFFTIQTERFDAGITDLERSFKDVFTKDKSPLRFPFIKTKWVLIVLMVLGFLVGIAALDFIFMKIFMALDHTYNHLTGVATIVTLGGLLGVIINWVPSLFKHNK